MWRSDRPSEQRSTRAFGDAAERRVRRHYRLRGYRILAANAWVAGYELDLVLRRGARLVVCEVKTKAGERYGHPFEMVTEEKARRIRRAAEAWLAGRPDLAGLEVTLEAAAVRGRRVERAPFD
jgi:putative endonuclease